MKLKHPFDIPPGAKVLGGNLDALGPAFAPAPAAGVVVEFAVAGCRPIPWKAPTVTKRGAYKSAKLQAWQSSVRRRALAAMGGRPPFAGTVSLTFAFHLAPRAGSPPDLSNLVKAAEDALQGAAIINDRQVRRHESSLTFATADGMTVRVEILAGITSGGELKPPTEAAPCSR